MSDRTGICYLYSIHMRTLTVLVALAFCLILVFRQKKASWRYILTLVLTIAVCVFAANQIKEILVENVYLSNASVSTNDYSGQVQKLSSLLSVDGVLALFFSFLRQSVVCWLLDIFPCLVGDCFSDSSGVQQDAEERNGRG